ncbi:MAG: ABC transporter ATP-binding protein [Desulfitobacteriaceae bacterium]|nr:ABC transporter ATP-binding protein [Desulfitobacteriaceae bacterium]
MNGIEVKNVTKNFGRVCALQDVSLKFEGHKIYGLLGRNGAGKSTLFKIITNRIFADHGQVFVDGQKVDNSDYALQRMYMMSEKNYFPESMKVKDVFKWTKEFYPDFDPTYAQTLAGKFKLDINKKVKSLSTGYSSIFKLIITLSSNAPYMLFDEPVLGLDANHRDLFYQTLLEKYGDIPSTVIISTHLIEEIERVIEDIIIIKSGKIIINEPLEKFLSKGYAVSGSSMDIDRFIADKTIMGSDCLGGLKTAYVLGDPDEIDIHSGIEVSKLDLQRLFIKLTNS